MIKFFIVFCGTFVAGMILVLLSVILTKILMKKTEKDQLHAPTKSGQLQSIVFDIDNFMEANEEPSITVASNDTNKDYTHDEKSIIKQIKLTEKPIEPIKTYNNILLFDSNTIKPLMNKITLEY